MYDNRDDGLRLSRQSNVSGTAVTSLLDRNRRSELSDGAVAGARHLSLRAARERRVCERILSRLLQFADPARAAELSHLLLDEFGSLSAVLAAPAAAQRRVAGTNRRALTLLQAVQAMHLRALRTDLPERLVMSDLAAVFDYLQAGMAQLVSEHLRALHLNSRHELLRDEVMSEGTIDQAPIYIREVIRRARNRIGRHYPGA